ncbi:MAG: hypothetical protein SOU16_07375 [Faecalimonas sp.]|nr:hypothetical protein [Faecalimonas sp.]
MKRYLRKVKTIMCSVLCTSMLLTNIVPAITNAQDRKKGISQSAKVLFQDNFNNYDSVADLESSGYKWLAENTELVTSIENAKNKMLKISNGSVSIPVSKANKEIQFNFKYEPQFTSFLGINVRVYKEGNDVDKAPEFSITPAFDQGNRVINDKHGLWKPQRAGADTQPGTWYTCKVLTEGGRIAGKVWALGDAEPEQWDIDVTGNFSGTDGEDRYVELNTNEANVGVMFDDIKITDSRTVEEAFFDDYESYGETIPGEEQGYGNVKNAVVEPLSEEEGGGHAIAVTGGSFEIPFSSVDKELKFDFKTSENFGSYAGLYIRMYKDDSGVEYYYGMLPGYNEGEKYVVDQGGRLNQSAGNTQIQKETWYTCKAQLLRGKLSVKVWERNSEEPKDWDIVGEKSSFKGEYGGNKIVVESSDWEGIKTWFDNVEIKKPELGENQGEVIACSNDRSMGRVIGSGIYTLGEEVTLTANAAADYSFVNWTEGNVVVSTEPTYVFTADGKEHKLTANFSAMKEPEYQYIYDDFESYGPGTAEKGMSEFYPKIDDGYSIVDLSEQGEEGQALKVQLADDSDHKIYMAYGALDKEFQFDFKYDGTFQDFGGIFVKMHAQPKSGEGDYNEYYFALCPNFGKSNVMISNTTSNLKSASKSMKGNKWYTCKARIHQGTMMVKVWERDAVSEPKEWDVSAELSGFDMTANGAQFKIEYVDGTKQVDTYLDNFSVKTWEEVSLEKCEVDAKPNDSKMGEVIGAGTYQKGTMITLRAKEKEDYQFVNWTTEDGTVVGTDKKYYIRANEDSKLIANFRKSQLSIKSFMADGLTKQAEIDEENKTIHLTFAADVDLSEVTPYFYYDISYTPSVLPYQVMDLSSGKVEFDGWTVTAMQNKVMKDIYVNGIRGNDSNSGNDPMQAFKTIERAQEEVRKISEWTGDVIVHLAKGEYRLDETLKFNQNDGATKGYSVIYQGAGANDTTITSGISLKGWRPSEDVPGVEGVYEIDVPEGASYSRDLFVGNRRASLAGAECDGNEISNRNDEIGGYTVNGNLKDMVNWRNKSDIEFVYYVMWTSNILPVEDVVQEGENTIVKMKEEPFQISKVKMNCTPDKPSMIINAFELLDEENEWYFDRERNKIYYIPEKGKNPDDLDIVLPTLQKLVEVKGEKESKVNGLAFKDIGFKYTSYLRPHEEGQIELQACFVYDPEMVQPHGHDNYLKTPGGVTAGYVEGMRVHDCTFSLMSAAGFDYEEGVVASTITKSRFEQIGATGMQIGGVHVRDAQPYSNVTYDKGVLNENAGPDPLRVTDDILVMSNVIDSVGNNFKGGIGIWAGYVSDLTIAHNVITNIAYSGISAGWGWGIWDVDVRPDMTKYYKFDTPTIQARYVIENNDISYCMQLLKDGGAIYTLSNMPGSMIRGNFIHDVAKEYGAIYLDEGTNGMEDISNNVVYNVYNPYFFNDKFGLFQELDNEAAEVIHDNFWTTGAPESGWETDENFLVVQENAGNLQNMIPPVLGESEVVDYSNLEKAILDASALDLTKYTEETVEILNTALTNAKALMEDESATQAEIDAAADNLKNAIEGLEEIQKEPGEDVDFTALEKIIAEGKNIDTSKYTEETVKVFKEALEKAQAVLENSDATQAEADAAVAELRSAIDALETLNEKTEKPEKPEKPEVPERPSKPSDNKLVDDSVKTGDASSFTYWIIVMVGVAVVGIVVICRRKYR